MISTARISETKHRSDLWLGSFDSAQKIWSIPYMVYLPQSAQKNYPEKPDAFLDKRGCTKKLDVMGQNGLRIRVQQTPSPKHGEQPPKPHEREVTFFVDLCL